MIAPSNNEDRSRSAEPVSPELALVDPVLAEQARLALPDRPEFPPVRSGAEQARAASIRGREDSSAAPITARRRQVRRRSGAAFGLIAAACLGGLASALVTATTGEPSPRVTYADAAPLIATDGNAAPVVPARTPSSATARAARPPSAAILHERVFAWAPVAKARAYEFQLFRGDTLVFRMRVNDPRLGLPPRWRLEGRAQSARPGSYRWYVWPILAGRTQPVKRAIVQATFVID